MLKKVLAGDYLSLDITQVENIRKKASETPDLELYVKNNLVKKLKNKKQDWKDLFKVIFSLFFTKKIYELIINLLENGDEHYITIFKPDLEVLLSHKKFEKIENFVDSKIQILTNS